jgi:outer membrane protein OmpA-like peptidoglycan-associated protein
LNPNGSKDHKLKIKDLPSIAIGDWRASTNNPKITPRDEANELIEAEDDRYLYTAEEVANGIPDIQLGKEYITTNTNTNTNFDPDSDSNADSYDDDINGDAEDADMNM